MLAEVLLVMAALMLATVGQWMTMDHCAPFFQSFSSHKKHEWVGRVTASVVDILLVGFGALHGASSKWGMALLLGYLLHDIGHMLIYETDVSSYIHHIMTTTILGLAKIAMTPEQVETSALATCILESTSPVLHSTWLLKQAGYSDQSFFKYLAVFSVAFFGIMRIGVFPWVMMKKMDNVTASVFAPIFVLSLYWFYKLIKMGVKLLRNEEDSSWSTEQSREA